MSSLQLVSMLPGLLVDTGGLLLALVRWSRHPTASLLAALGLAARLAGAFASTWAVAGLASDRTLMTSVMAVSSLLGSGGLALVVAAVFVDRAAAPS
jgi:hypothetical protein